VASADVRYLVFDIESVADGSLISKLKYPDQHLDPAEAISRYRQELMEQHNSDFIPYTYQIPVSVAIAKVSADLNLIDLKTLDDPDFRPHVISENFWRGWEAYHRPTLVTFNGRCFDLPLMELAALRYGLEVPGWFDLQARSYEQPRNRYNVTAHLDLYDLLTNFGASRFHGGLNLAANLLGKPGKMGVQGDMVQDLYDQGRLSEINQYCCCDVLDTFFVFLRTCVMRGMLKLEQEQMRITETRDWLEERRDQRPAFAQYLDGWGDWENPWTDGGRGHEPR